MKSELPPPGWKRAVESDDWIAVITLVLTVFVMAAEALAR